MHPLAFRLQELHMQLRRRAIGKVWYVNNEYVSAK